jgi:hypothetical protein
MIALITGDTLLLYKASYDVPVTAGIDTRTTSTLSIHTQYVLGRMAYSIFSYDIT